VTSNFTRRPRSGRNELTRIQNYLSPSTPLGIFVRLERLILAIPNALQKLNLFQIPAAAPVRLELRGEFGFTAGRRVDMRFPLERGHL
jgi:hypothetical protein